MYQESVDLSHIPPEGLKLERRVHANAWKISEKDWISRGDLAFEIFLKGNPTKTKVDGNFTAEVLANCHRCLKPVPLDLKRRFHVTYLAPDPARLAKEELELADAELEVSYLENHFLPIHQMLAEQIYLSVPMKVLCQEDCRGLCTNCGVDLNQVECGCPQERLDPRWAKLRSIVTDTPDQ